MYYDQDYDILSPIMFNNLTMMHSLHVNDPSSRFLVMRMALLNKKMCRYALAPHIRNVSWNIGKHRQSFSEFSMIFLWKIIRIVCVIISDMFLSKYKTHDTRSDRISVA